jgi:hypothetical protein
MRIIRQRGKRGMQENGKTNKIQKCCSMNDRNGIIWLRFRNSKVRAWKAGEKGNDIHYIDGERERVRERESSTEFRNA